MRTHSEHTSLADSIGPTVFVCEALELILFDLILASGAQEKRPGGGAFCPILLQFLDDQILVVLEMIGDIIHLEPQSLVSSLALTLGLLDLVLPRLKSEFFFGRTG